MGISKIIILIIILCSFLLAIFLYCKIIQSCNRVLQDRNKISPSNSSNNLENDIQVIPIYGSSNIKYLVINPSNIN